MTEAVLVERLTSSVFLSQLQAAFGDPPARGSKIALDEIIAVLGHNDAAPKQATIIQYWRKVLWAEHGIVTTRRKGFLHILSPDEQYTNGRRKITLATVGVAEGIARIEPIAVHLPTASQREQAAALLTTYKQTFATGFVRLAELAHQRREQTNLRLPPPET